MGEHTYIIYGTTHCAFCKDACSLLESRGIEHIFLNMEEDRAGLEEAKQYYKHDTVPIILKSSRFNGETNFIGGYDELVGFLNG